MKYILSLILLALPLISIGQTKIDFGVGNYKRIGVYDTWEESPFRTGRLKGRTKVMKNPFTHPAVSEKVLAVQCSRHGSNTFGVRVDLEQPFAISPQTQYVHVMLHKPVPGRVMLIGLGKRTERAGQSPEAEQCWVYSSRTVLPNTWNDAVFPVRGSEGVEIHSLVIVPQCESPHTRTEDFAAYIGDILIDDTFTPRLEAETANGFGDSQEALDGKCLVSSNSRNGDVVATDGQPLNRLEVPFKKKYKVKAVPSRGFRCAGLIVKRADKPGSEARLISAESQQQEEFTLPAQLMQGDIMIEGLFVELP